ncbi:unnamed protein product, partial [marine sediment metagenome]
QGDDNHLSSGAYVIQGGYLNVQNLLNMNRGTSRLEVDGGSVTVGTDMNVGYFAGATSTVDVKSGLLDLDGVSMYYGNGSSDVNLSGGTVDTGGGNVDFTQQYNGDPTTSGTDTLNISGGLLDMAGGNIIVREATGQITFSGGRLADAGVIGLKAIVPDQSGNGNDGVMGGVMRISDGADAKFGKAIAFDGDDDWVDFGTGHPLSSPGNTLDEYAVSMWFKRDVDHSGTAKDTNHLVNNVLYSSSGI